jgi:hypothetical protein
LRLVLAVELDAQTGKAFTDAQAEMLKALAASI